MASGGALAQIDLRREVPTDRLAKVKVISIDISRPSVRFIVVPMNSVICPDPFQKDPKECVFHVCRILSVHETDPNSTNQNILQKDFVGTPPQKKKKT